MTEFQSAIPSDELLDKPLGEMSAADFVAALSHPAVNPEALAILPTKQKYEGGLDKLNLRDMLDRIRGEKKKYELETHPERNILNDPRVIEQIANKIADRLQSP